MINEAAIYIFLIITFFVSKTIFFLILGAILIFYWFAPAATFASAQAESVFTNMVWIILAIIIILIIILAFAGDSIVQKMKGYMGDMKAMHY